MKIAIIQCDVSSDLLINTNRIAAFCKSAANADLCIIAAGALTGLQQSCCPGLDQAITALAKEIEQAPPLLCGITPGQILLLRQGRAEAVSQEFQLNSLDIAVQNPAKSGKADIFINLCGWRYWPCALEQEQRISADQARQFQAFVLAPNLVGGYGDLIFSGQSLALNQAGELIGRGKAFQEDLLLVDTAASAAPAIAPVCASRGAEQWQALTLGLADFVRKAGAKKVLLGLSGGMDSALVAALAASALGPDNVTGVLMPSMYTSTESITDAHELAENLGIKTFTVPIEPMFRAFLAELGSAFASIEPVANDLAEENLQARIRGVILMALSNRSGALVLNTGNKSESAMGYCTLYGDTVGAVAVIGDLFKTEVYALAKWFNEDAGRELIPRSIFTKPPTAELRPGQKDTDSLPPYAELDPRLEELLQGKSDRLLQRVKDSAFKRRQCPRPLLVSAHPLAQLC